MLSNFRIALWGAVAAAIGLALGVFVFSENVSAPDGSGRSGLLGGPFQLVQSDGSAFTEKDLEGEPYAIFFGFTHCPDVCPTTLYEMTDWIDQMGPAADKMKFVFVTIDPERDTPDILGDYVYSFNDKVIALSGSTDQIDNIKKLYRVYAARVPLDDGDYTMDHTASVYLMDESGDFVGTIGYGEEAATAVEKLKKLVGESTS